ncbi:hypothetical protein SAMN04489712_101537 [Thermomonospora echinospora]|uniref:DUF4261 domain-containing protein n=1 Tax=Thermomonospora echinospora TaxID=1992 RepID=A0A1H5T9P8_9ACTN|nr:hypothetical protein [Thermomonospora echinospora]SEF59510.1 hypothetical protein SAMN04489712_101537 [Thermomonospora echinospora]
MGATLSLTIPESTTTRFLIATDDRSAPGVQRLRDALPAGGLARTARDLLASPLLLVTGCRAADSPWACRLPGLGGGAAELAALRSARHHLVVTSIATPAAQPRHAQAARLVARTLAAITGGRVADLAANQLLTDPTGTESERFALHDDWLGVFVSPDPGPNLRADTAGLHRFGLPELLVRGVPYGRLLTAVNVLRGLAFRLLADHRAWLSAAPGAGDRQLPADPDLDLGDILRYWGTDPPDLGGPLPLHLVPSPADCPECGTGLRITPPGGQADLDWWDRTVAPAMPVHPEAC